MRSRIEDVAAVAGVSMKTVSRVLNHEPKVREETRERVMRAVGQLQYKPNLSACSLAGHRSCMVALVYGNGPACDLAIAGADPHARRRPHGARRTHPAVPRIDQAAEATHAASCTLSRCTRLSPPPPMR